MEKACKEEEKLSHQWTKEISTFFDVACQESANKSEALKRSTEVLAEAKRLFELHEQTCKRISQSQAPPEDIERFLTGCRQKQFDMRNEMAEAEVTLENLRLSMDVAGGGDEVGQGAAAAIIRQGTGSRRSCSTSASLRSAQERVRTQMKLKELEAKKRLLEKKRAASLAAATAAAEAEATQAGLRLEEEMLEAQFAYDTARVVEEMENEQDLGSDDPDGNQVTPPLDPVYSTACLPPSSTPQRSEVALVGPPEIKTFSGLVKDWIGFVLAFEEVVAKRVQSNTLKLQKLIQFSCPKVRDRIQIFQHDTVRGYERAMKYLWEVYGHPTLLVNELVNDLTNGQPQIRARDREELLMFHHRVQCTIETVEAIQSTHCQDLSFDYRSCLENQEVLVKLLKRLPTFLATEFVDSLDKAPGSVKELSAFLSKKTSSGAHPLLLTLAQDKAKESARSRDVGTGPAKKPVYLVDEAADDSDDEGDVFATRETWKGCYCCGQDHALNNCPTFNGRSPVQRRRVLMKAKLCFNCFGRHFHADCEVPSRCKRSGCNWKGKHDPRIHVDPSKRKKNASYERQDVSERKRASEIREIKNDATFCSNSTNRLFMGTVGVRLTNPVSNQSISCFALLDPCSSLDIMTEEAVDRLGLSVNEMEKETAIHTVNGTVRAKMKVADVIVEKVEHGLAQSLHGVKVVERGCFDNNRCPTSQDRSKWPSFASVVTAEEVDVPRVLVLISMKNVDLQRPESVSPVNNGVYTVRTKLGHVVYGGGDQLDKAGDVFFIDDRTFGDKLDRLLELDNVAGAKMYDARKLPSYEERRAAEKIRRSIRVNEGTYEVAVPWKEDEVSMPNNRHAAIRRVEEQRQRFRNNPKEFEEYNAVMQSYIADGHAEEVPESELETEPGKKHYLFHHAVKHPRKDKKRIVFNASHKVNGVSINDRIMSVPDKLERLVGLLIRFREKRVAITADIVAFFHNVLIPKADRDFNRFIWFKDGKLCGQLAEFRLKKHLFGGVASQCCAVMALNHCLEKQVPDVWSTDFCQRAIRSFYSDDFLDSFDSLDDAVASVKLVRSALDESGFKLAKFRSNCKEVASALVAGEAPEPDQNEDVSALGLSWNLNRDVISLGRCWKSDECRPTKRGVLSLLMGQYDPLGLMIPFTLGLKLFLQELMVSELGWDDVLAEDRKKELAVCIRNIKRAETIQVTRWLTFPGRTKARSHQLHLFADGSSKSYGACAYLRTEFEDGLVSSQLIMAKNRICPAKKSLTIPRIELNAAVVAVRLAKFIEEETSLDIHSTHFWVDSVSTLRYINNKCKRFHVYVANRISEIQDSSEISSWRYVKTGLNVADLASRSVILGPSVTEDTRVTVWFGGPEFLTFNSSEWPNEVQDLSGAEEDREWKAAAYVTQHSQSRPVLDTLLLKSPSMEKMKLRIAWLSKYCSFLAKKKIVGPDRICPPRSEDLAKAERKIVCLVQQQAFEDELNLVKRSMPLPKGSALRKLSLFVDEEGLLRVGSRLSEGDLPYDFRYPMLLPKVHHVVHLLVSEAHLLVGHQGVNHVLSHLRQRFWIIGARTLVKSLINQCISCKRYNARTGQQLMADLPKKRITLDEPFFSSTSVDLFGPFLIKRARSLVKRYVCLFCCLSSRACHLEVVASLDMDSFLEAFRRFQCRRGQVKELTSDNATNFRAANSELVKVMAEWNGQGLGQRLLQRGVDWVFLTPKASHHGGAHERLIRSARSCLRHVLDGQTLSDECFHTVVVECEFILNSRPLTPSSDDPSDLRPLSPNDVLIPRPGPGLPPGPHPPGERFRRRWRTVQQLTCQFWKRFYKEYLSLLSLRTKWLTKTRDFAVGDLVLVAEDNLPRSQWLMGRITSVVIGRDGHVRSCQIRTPSSTVYRPVVKICLLEATVDQASCRESDQ